MSNVVQHNKARIRNQRGSFLPLIKRCDGVFVTPDYRFQSRHKSARVAQVSFAVVLVPS